MGEDLEKVWKALADPTRRRILDLLRDGPRTTTAIAAAFPTTRYAIMKHLRVLERAGLVLVERRGRERWNHLNAVPLRAIYERWISRYADRWAVSLLSLKRHLERPRAQGEPAVYGPQDDEVSVGTMRKGTSLPHKVRRRERRRRS